MDAAVGALASKVTPSMVSVELPEMLGVGVEVRVAIGAVTVPAVPLPRFVLQSFFTPLPKMFMGGLNPRGMALIRGRPARSQDPDPLSQAACRRCASPAATGSAGHW